MKILLFGATGMVGQGVLRECLVAPDVEAVLSIGRRPSGKSDPKLQERVSSDLTDLSELESFVSQARACFFCLGVSSVGLSEADYRKISYDLPLAIARKLQALNPNLTFVYVSGTGTDSSEKGRVMWARIKGQAENAIQKLFPSGYAFRPAYIHPLHGVVSPLRSYRIAHTLLGPVHGTLIKLFPNLATTSEAVGRAMLTLARTGNSNKVIENKDINRLGG